jgi:glycosyltransferase involved in cell wall biosynthesis
MSPRSSEALIPCNIGVSAPILEPYPRRLRCLLLSPLPPLDPDNGDAQFTRDLLDAPPEGVELVPYAEALASGELEHGPSIRSGRPHPAALARAALGAARRAGLLLPDPVRWLRVRGGFDLVHLHCMPVRFLGPTPPLVVSDSAGTFWYWTAGRGFSERHVDRQLARERRAARALGFVHPSARPEPARRLLLFVDSGRALLERNGISADGALRCPPGVPTPLRRAEGDGRTLLFVARDFQAKGGPAALEVVRSLRAAGRDVRLIVAGVDAPDPALDGVEWLGPLSRVELYSDVYPQSDLFLYPTTFDCAPLVVQEALAHGIPVVAPRVFALPELVRDGETGVLFPPGDIDAATRAVEQLLDDPARRYLLSASAAADHIARFSVERRNEILGRAYAEAAR